MFKKIFATLSLVTTICLFNNSHITSAAEATDTLDSVETTDITTPTFDDTTTSDDISEAAENMEQPTSIIDASLEVTDNPDNTTSTMSDTSEAIDNPNNTTSTIDDSSDVTEAPTPTIEGMPKENLKPFVADTSSNEKVIGVDSRTVVKNYLANPYKKIVLLKMHFKTGFFSGTGAMINKNTVLTAAHNVYDYASKSFADQITVLAGVAPGKIPLGTATAIQKFVPDEWINSGASEHDFAVLKLNNDLGNKTGFFTFSQDISLNQPLQIAGYPGDKKTHTQYTGKGTLLDFNKDNLFYNVDTYNGESGSPILNAQNEIIGVHTNGPGGYNYGTRINNDKLALIKQWSIDPKPVKHDKDITITKPNINIGKDLNVYTPHSNKNSKLRKPYQPKYIYTRPNVYTYLSLLNNYNDLKRYVNKVEKNDLFATKANRYVKPTSKKAVIWTSLDVKKITQSAKRYNKAFKVTGIYTLKKGNIMFYTIETINGSVTLIVKPQDKMKGF
ncbi:serine peptidase, S1 family [Staphylococcus microti]|uniref:Serine protease n=1 Tax=Staphylococcus microti TaxID=569857 RepID=A0A380GYS3_9STAP|nr:trypsin-like serine protease [Staphylococcus microti]PNZ84462.1 hypothetical protein CD132_00515 [Staphylococcus microti]SUM58338.1 serine peptidase, S1 family [Staphylococcus microti]